MNMLLNVVEQRLVLYFRHEEKKLITLKPS